MLLWRCALENNRLCHLALANKHTFGLDQIPISLEHAYGELAESFIITVWVFFLEITKFCCSRNILGYLII